MFHSCIDVSLFLPLSLSPPLSLKAINIFSGGELKKRMARQFIIGQSRLGISLSQLSFQYALLPFHVDFYSLISRGCCSEDISPSETCTIIFISTFLQFLQKKNTVLGNFRPWSISSNLQTDFICHYNFVVFSMKMTWGQS